MHVLTHVYPSTCAPILTHRDTHSYRDTHSHREIHTLTYRDTHVYYIHSYTYIHKDKKKTKAVKKPN